MRRLDGLGISSALAASSALRAGLNTAMQAKGVVISDGLDH
ncbi:MULTISPECIES: hypothetical protein [Pseudomonas]|nr:hypothetical protein [Pseudomonas sp. LRP2-20]BDM23450.1 hypothetical protein KMS_R32070 [Pseudomonas sp. LRP2-20]